MSVHMWRLSGDVTCLLHAILAFYPALGPDERLCLDWREPITGKGRRRTASLEATLRHLPPLPRLEFGVFSARLAPFAHEIPQPKVELSALLPLPDESLRRLRQLQVDLGGKYIAVYVLDASSVSEIEHFISENAPLPVYLASSWLRLNLSSRDVARIKTSNDDPMIQLWACLEAHACYGPPLKPFTQSVI